MLKRCPMPDIEQRGASANSQSSEKKTAAPRGDFDFGPDGKLWIAGLLVVLAFLAFALCRNINAPWVEDDNWYGAVYSQAAHNNLRAGILTTAGVPVTLYFGPLPIPLDAYYVHHPTWLPTMVTGAFAVFGESEWAARLVPVTCSLLSVILLWLLVRSAIGIRAATLTAAIFATLPMEIHYGDMVDFEPCLLMWMLAVLLCVRHWHVTGRTRWAALAAAVCLLALWTDWPGYLFVISLSGYFLFKWWRGQQAGVHIAPKQSLRFGLILLGVGGLSGIFFLVQIRYVRPDAWSDLWSAMTMRLSNRAATDAVSAAQTTVHFTLWEWCRAILRGVADDFLLPPWFLAAAGLFFIWKDRRNSEALRWCGFAMTPMIVAGVLYVVILRNESFVHDFATFYLIGALAMAGGIGSEGLLTRLERKVPGKRFQIAIALAVIGVFVWIGRSALTRAESLRSQFYVLNPEKPEPPDFIPSLGRHLGRTFPFGTKILCNFGASGTLDYYSQRPVLNGITRPQDWKISIAEQSPPLGGIIWLDEPDAPGVVASLPREELTDLTLGGFRFALWRAQGR